MLNLFSRLWDRIWSEVREEISEEEMNVELTRLDIRWSKNGKDNFARARFRVLNNAQKMKGNRK